MKILVALDISPQSAAIVEHALGLLAYYQAEGIFYTVVEDILDFGEGMAVELGDTIRKQSRNALNTAVKQAQSKGIQAQALLESGPSPADSILDCAEKEGIDMIIMGSRAKTGLDRFLIGSVASKVVSHAKCSVLVLR